MSMLAEPRRKQKVINLRAKNNAWSNDSNKFGQRMLEKMGWSSGKGLGANENGIVEHVVAKYKNDDKGLGFEDRNDQWTKNEDDFNTLLANLSNADSGTETLHSGISLEKKSKTSKARIHYHKYTRGKDLSRYSEKDLANIFGKKSFKPAAEECIKEDTVKTTEQFFTEKGNMDDYFKTKLAAIKSKSKLLNTHTISNDESDYTFQGFSNSTAQEPVNNQNGFEYQPFSLLNTSQKDDLSQNVALSSLDVEVKSKKKKKSKKKELFSEAEVEFNNLLVCTQEETQEEITKVKKSKKKSSLKYIDDIKSLNKVEEDNSLECTQEAPQEIVTKIETKKSKKKREKCIDDIQSSDKLAETTLSECTEEILINKETTKVKKSKKKHQKHVEDEILPKKIKKRNKSKNHVENMEEHIIISTEDSIPNKKKKKKIQDL